jgi:hypothetical protein
LPDFSRKFRSREFRKKKALGHPGQLRGRFESVRRLARFFRLQIANQNAQRPASLSGSVLRPRRNRPQEDFGRVTKSGFIRHSVWE